MALDKFNWKNGTQIEPAKVEIGGQSYNVSDAQYEGETPLSASNLNLMQDIILGNVKDNLDDDTKIPSVKAVKGKIIWTNQNPTSYFNAGTITLDESLDNYDTYEILALQSVTNPRMVTTGKIPVGHGTFLMQGAERRPTGTTVSGNTITFEDNRNIIPPNDTHNEQMIPMYVIGHNTGLF